MYLIRLDDASEKRDIEKWDRMESLLDEYHIKPLVGVIPHNEDESMKSYSVDEYFWERVQKWDNKGWQIAIHGYNHKLIPSDGGLNPINLRSEFAGLPLEMQEIKIAKAVTVFHEHGLHPKVFCSGSYIR